MLSYRNRLLVLLVTVTILVTAIGMVSTSSTSYLSEDPGPAISLVPLVSGGRRTGKVPVERFYLTTIQVSSVNWWQYLTGSVFGHSGSWFIPTPPAKGITPAQIGVSDTLLMDSALRTAEAVAGKATGSPSMHPNGAIVVLEAHGSAWSAGLRIRDRIAAVNGKHVTSASALVGALKAVPVGGPITLGVARKGQALTIHIHHNPGVGKLGVELVTGWAGSPAASISVPGVGGPSGGLLAALALTAVEGGGDLAGPNIVAGTGTLSSSGAVGPITGAPDKVVGAERVGATVFFVPVLNAPAVEAEHPRLTVVPVNSYRAAINWLCTHGGTSPACG